MQFDHNNNVCLHIAIANCARFSISVQLSVGVGVIEHRVSGQLPMRSLQLNQLQQGAPYGSRSIAGIEERIAHHGHQLLQLLRQLLLHILTNAGQYIE